MKDFFTKERLRAIISFVLSFFVCLGVFTTALTAGALYFVKESSIVKCAEKSGYTALAVQDMTDELNELAIPSGLPENFFDDKVDSNAFNKLFYSSLKNVLAKNEDFILSIEDFKNEVAGKVTEYTKSEVETITSETKKDIADFSEECGKIYLSYINPSLLSYILSILGSVSKYAILANAFSIVLVLICAFMLFKLNTKKSFLMYLFTSIMGAALTVGVIPGFLLITDELSRIGITSKSLFAIVTSLGNGFLTALVVSAAILAVVALVFLVIKIYDLIFKR